MYPLPAFLLTESRSSLEQACQNLCFFPVMVSLVILLGAMWGCEASKKSPDPMQGHDARTILESAANIAGTISSRDERGNSLFRIAEAQSQLGHWDGALQSIHMIPSGPWKTSALARYVTALAESGDVAAALQTVESFDMGIGKDEAYVGIVAAQVKQGLLQDAQHTMSFILSEEKREVALSVVAMALVESGKVQEALETAETRGGSETLLMIAMTQAELSDLQGALNTVNIIQDSESKDEALLGIVETQTKKELFQTALNTITLIVDEGTRNLAYQYIMTQQVEVGDIDGALATVALLDTPTFDAHGLIAKAQAQAGRLDEAMETASRIQDSYLADEVRETIAVMYAQKGDLNTALHIARKTISSSHWTGEALQDIAVVQLKAGHAQEALQLINQIHDDGMLIGGLEQLAVAQAQLGDIQAALTLCQTIALHTSEGQRPIFQSQALLAVANSLVEVSSASL